MYGCYIPCIQIRPLFLCNEYLIGYFVVVKISKFYSERLAFSIHGPKMGSCINNFGFKRPQGVLSYGQAKPWRDSLSQSSTGIPRRSHGPGVWRYSSTTASLMKNYRPISLLSHVYKLFSRFVTNRLATTLDEFQPPENAGFRNGYSIVDHVYAVRQIMQNIERV